MKILILSWRGPGHPHAGGAEIVTHEHSKAWVKKSYEVTLITSSFEGCKKEEIIDGVKIIRLPGTNNINLQIITSPISAFLWYVFKNKENFDLVIDHFHGWPFFTPLYVKSKKLAFIHEVANEVWIHNPWKWPLNLILAFIGIISERPIFYLYKKIPFLTVSNSTKEDLIKFDIPENLIEVINNGVIIEKVKKIKKEKNPTIAFLGAIAKDKGIEDAIKIFNVLEKLNINFRFWVIGKGDKKYLDYLNRNLINFPKKKIRFWGFVSEKKKFELLSRIHILINPSFKEGWGLVNIEANSMKIPVIGYNVSGTKDSIIDKKTGILVPLNDIDNFSVEVNNLINNPKMYLELRKNAYIWSKNFSWKKSTNKSLEIINKIIKNT